jgi:hypothetical protein
MTIKATKIEINGCIACLVTPDKLFRIVIVIEFNGERYQKVQTVHYVVQWLIKKKNIQMGFVTKTCTFSAPEGSLLILIRQPKNKMLGSFSRLYTKVKASLHTLNEEST